MQQSITALINYNLTSPFHSFHDRNLETNKSNASVVEFDYIYAGFQLQPYEQRMISS
jgi:hypothetical protein